MKMASKIRKFGPFAGVMAMILLANGAHAAPQSKSPAPFLDIYKELIEINTTDSVGDTTKAAEAMRTHLIASGFDPADVEVIAPFPRKGNLVARLRGTGEGKPILLLAHIDVVEAKREDWTHDPFVLREENGHFYARGAIDDKSMAAAFVSILSEMKAAGYKPKRDIILALTADEERGGAPSNGAQWLIDNRRDLIDAEFGINEGGRGELRNGRPFQNVIQTSEKLLAQFEMEVTGPGGHSSRPTPDNVLYELASAMTRLADYQFPVQLNDATRLYFQRSAPLQTGQNAKDFLAVSGKTPDHAAIDRLSQQPNFLGMLRTTCVATMMQGGHAPNALAQSAKTSINCRILPTDDVDSVEKALKAVAGPKVTLRRLRGDPRSPGSPIRPDLFETVEKLTTKMWPGVPTIPVMGVSTTDSRRFRSVGIPMYGVSGLFIDPDNAGLHGLNEHVGVEHLKNSRTFLYQLVKELSE